MLPKRFSFVVIVILLHTSVKIVKTVKSHHCLFVAVPIFSLFYFSYHSWWIKMSNKGRTTELLVLFSFLFFFYSFEHFLKRLLNASSRNRSTRCMRSVFIFTSSFLFSFASPIKFKGAKQHILTPYWQPLCSNGATFFIILKQTKQTCSGEILWLRFTPVWWSTACPTSPDKKFRHFLVTSARCLYMECPQSSLEYTWCVNKSSPPETFWNIFNLVKSFCLNFCKFGGSSYPHISAIFFVDLS